MDPAGFAESTMKEAVGVAGSRRCTETEVMAMRSAMTRISKILLPVLGLVWVIGCSNPTGHSNGGGTTFTLDLSIEPDSVQVNEMGVVSCFLKSNGVLLDDETVYFSAVSEATSNSTITGASISSSLSPTGMNPEVHYWPVDFAGDVDTIYAHLQDSAGDTVAINWITVTIIH
jgi:hypothetical protein